MSDRERLLALARAAASSLERSRARIDDLNVYPVPDGDTGTNLLLTARAIAEALAGSSVADRGSLARETTRAALLGARGNSGVILSQIVRGAGEVLCEADPIDARAVARALRAGSDAAYRAVRRPVEGTMLTVIRELAEEAEASARDQTPAELLATLVRRGDEAVVRTREQLEVLREAGVVDAGGAGLVELARGLAAGLAGHPLPEPVTTELATELAVGAGHRDLSRYRYCTVFVIEGSELDLERLERELEPLGDSLLVVGDPEVLKVHVHTDDPGAALALGTRAGAVEGVEIANMHRQTEQRAERLLTGVPVRARANATDVVAVAVGAGNRRLFESLGAAEVVEGGATMNPAASELAAAVERARAAEVVLLPNHANVLLSAEQAAGLAARPVTVVSTRSMQAGLAAMIAFDGDLPAGTNAERMHAAAEAVATGAVTRASRALRLDGRMIAAGDYLGLVGEEPIVGGADFSEVTCAVVERLLEEPRDVLTLLTGRLDAPLDELLAKLKRNHPDLELDVQAGGQPHYLLLLGAE